MKIQTDNSYLSEKVQLRIESLPKKDVVYVLECFAGDGLIWKEVKRITKRNIKILRIDQKDDKKGIYLKGDNLKFLQSMDLSRFDVVDLDAYGSPFTQLEIIRAKQFKGIVHCTFIQSMFGALNKRMLFDLGYTKSMIEKIPSLFNKDGIQKLLTWVHIKTGAKQVHIISRQKKKHYFWFTMQ